VPTRTLFIQGHQTGLTKFHVHVILDPNLRTSVIMDAGPMELGCILAQAKNGFNTKPSVYSA